MMTIADSSPEFELGYQFGSSIGVLIPIAFLVFAVRSLLQADRNKKCSLSMVLLAAAWGIMSIGYSLSRITGASGIMAPLLVASTLAVLTGATFAVLGLIELSGSARPPAGRTQAIVALVLSCLFAVCATIGYLGRNPGIPDDWKMAQPLPGSRVSVVSKNFSIAFPGPGWVQVIPSKLNKKADVAFIQTKTNLCLIVLAHEAAGANLKPLPLFVEAARMEMTQIKPGAIVEEAQPLNVGRCQGAAFTAEAPDNGKTLIYREWVSLHGSVVYQVLSWGKKSDADLIRRETDAIVGTFETLVR